VAKRIGRTSAAVKAQRLKLGLRQTTRPEHRSWTPSEEKMLGQKTDEQLAKEFAKPRSEPKG